MSMFRAIPETTGSAATPSVATSSCQNNQPPPIIDPSNSVAGEALGQCASPG
jgi:hypothetical protein